MGLPGLPSKLTEEEEALLAKFALIKRKKKAQSTSAKVPHTNKVEAKPPAPLLPVKKKESVVASVRPTKVASTAKKELPKPANKTPIAPKDAKEKAKQLLASGQLKIDKGNETRSFKRARVSSNAEKKNDTASSKCLGKKSETKKTVGDFSDPDLSDLDDDKGNNSNSFNNNKHSIHNKPYNSKNDVERNKNFDNDSDNRNNFDNGSRYENHNHGRRGNHHNNNNNNNSNYRQTNLFVSGHDLSKEMLERVFAPFGDVKTIYFDQDKGNGFVTYFKNECAAAAIEALHGEMVEGRTLRVVYARRQRTTDKFDDNRYTWRAGRNNHRPSGDSDRPERPPRDLDSAPSDAPLSKPARTMEDRISVKPPEKKERKVVNYNDSILSYNDNGGGDGFDF